jgi:hypothetical protein
MIPCCIGGNDAAKAGAFFKMTETKDECHSEVFLAGINA